MIAHLRDNRPVYRRPYADNEILRNPVELWLAGGERYHSKKQRMISSAAEVLPRGRAPRGRCETPCTGTFCGSSSTPACAGARSYLCAGKSGYGAADPQNRGDQERGASGVSRYPAARGDLGAPAEGRTVTPGLRTCANGCSPTPRTSRSTSRN